MKRHQNTKNNIFHNIVLLSLCSMLFTLRAKLSVTCAKFLALSFTLLALLMLSWIFYPEHSNSGPYIDDSAHGSSEYGVKRNATGFPSDYARGLCAHCHEQHASIGGAEPVPNSPAGPDFYLLFQNLWESPIQSNLFCFGCHKESDSYQTGGHIFNYSYSHQGGGDTDTCPDSIYRAFQFVQNNGQSQPNCLSNIPSNVGSSHMLKDIRDETLRGKWGFSSTGSQVDACSGCHNPHKAKKDFPCSLPSAHANIYAWEVWGDDSSEKMNIYTPYYWAPRRVGGGYEPDGSFTQNGSNVPNYVTLCTNCHNATNVIKSTRLGRNLFRINWGAGGDFHGTRPRNDGPGDKSGDEEFGDLLEPYKVGSSYTYNNYVLSCTDCHEPHGSPNEFLLRKAVNGASVGIISGNGLWSEWCANCHSFSFSAPTMTHPPPSGNDCFSAGGCHRHCDQGPCGLFGTLF
jgi:cytochrome c553